MAIPFKSPEPKHRFIINKEKRALSNHFDKRLVPASSKNRLLLASWNIANLGAQKRTPGALKLIAHILERFDLIAVQEVNDNFVNFDKVVKLMQGEFSYFMSDTAGNQERLAFIFRKDKVTPGKLFSELSFRPIQYPKRNVTVNWSKKGKPQKQVFKKFRFSPFDRNPYIGSFQAGKINFTLANVHLYFGAFQNSKTEKDRKKYARRVLEIYALSRWSSGRIKKHTTYDKDIILLGDMNVPCMKKTESTYKALIKFGWKPVDYATRTGGSNLGNDKTYDQMAFAPGSIGNRIKKSGVFDFDKAVFAPLWRRLSKKHSARKALSQFNRHVKHHLSDHRPLWVEIAIN